MDVFRFMNPSHITLLEHGQLVNGMDSKMWVERYREPGEFEFTADVEEGVHKLLTVGTLISHVDTTEVMMVENQQIEEDYQTSPKVKITGRSFESVLENRIVGANKDWPTAASATVEYLLSAGYSWNQIVQMIKDHIDIDFVYDPDDALLHVKTVSEVVASSSEEERSIARGLLHAQVLELLAVDDLGIKTVRPGPLSPFGIDNQDLAIVIHRGLDLRSKLHFSHFTGDIESADYLWTNKKLKNAALITGRWVETTVKTIDSGIDRRMMYVDGSDIDGSFETAPTGPDLTLVIAIMQARGRAILYSQRDIVLVKTETNKNQMTYKYRKDYDLGDIVTVNGEYSATAPMQITEYVEIEDENGQTGYPTLIGLS